MKNKIFKTDNSLAPFFLRIGLGLVVFAHGAQKLFGWFNGFGFTGSMKFFTESEGLPWILGFLIIILESIGALALVAGFATRFLAASLGLLALGIVLTTRIEFGFFMNWFGNQAGEGYEFFIFWIAMAISLLITGGGKYTAD
ncbi:MAG: DoxX family protein, partial [Bacteroidota bacterium]|nr:DoxX family protein [Bacteroidota bacterium]